MTASAGMFFGEDSSGRKAAASSAYTPFYGFPRSLRIIVADDEKDTVTTLKAILDDEGHDVVGAYSGSQVLSALREFRPDVLILDIAMPDISGFVLAKRIRAQFGAVHPMLIAISGLYNKAPDKVLAQAVGFDHHLAKPCHPAELLALLAPLSAPGE
jgi:DNA-binding response OmpR family regulator